MSRQTPLTDAVSQTTRVLHVFADGTLGNDSNDGALLASGTGGSFSYAGGVVTATLTGAVLTAAHIGKLITINNSTSNGNDCSVLITGVPAADQITYANARGVTEAFSGAWYVSSPKKTVSALIPLIPFYIRHAVVVHLSGIFAADPSSPTFTGFLDRGYYLTGAMQGSQLIFDGGTALTVFADNGGSPWVADIHSTTSVGLTTAGWAIDAYVGYFLEIVDGACAGQHRTIYSNTATTLTPNKGWTGDPGLCQFRIVRPTTELQSGGSFNKTLCLTGFTGGGYLWIQNLYITGKWNNIQCKNTNNQGGTQFSHCITNGDAGGLFSAYNCSYAPIPGATRLNSSSMAYDLVSACCPSNIYANSSMYIQDCPGGVSLYGLISKGLITISASTSFYLTYGSRIWGLTLNNSLMDRTDGITNGGGVYPVTKVEGSGLILNGSSLKIGSGVDISNCSSHGITCKRSFLTMTGAVTGTGNVGAGVYAHSGSVVTIKNGSPPTLTGSVGDLSTDGTTPAGTWAGIDGGERIFDLNEGTLIKEVA